MRIEVAMRYEIVHRKFKYLLLSLKRKKQSLKHLVQISIILQYNVNCLPRNSIVWCVCCTSYIFFLLINISHNFLSPYFFVILHGKFYDVIYTLGRMSDVLCVGVDAHKFYYFFIAKLFGYASL